MKHASHARQRQHLRTDGSIARSVTCRNSYPTAACCSRNVRLENSQHFTTAQTYGASKTAAQTAETSETSQTYKNHGTELNEQRQQQSQPEPQLEQEPEPETDQWFHVSDTHVTEVTLDKVLKAQAYMLFYERTV